MMNNVWPLKFFVFPILAFVPFGFNLESSFHLIEKFGGNTYSDVQETPNVEFPELYLKPIKVLSSESRYAILKVFIYQGEDISIDRLSDISWTLENDSVANLVISDSRVMLIGLKKGVTQLHVSALLGDLTLSTQTTVTVYDKHI